jgi:hypothetical protein
MHIPTIIIGLIIGWMLLRWSWQTSKPQRKKDLPYHLQWYYPEHEADEYIDLPPRKLTGKAQQDRH